MGKVINPIWQRRVTMEVEGYIDPLKRIGERKEINELVSDAMPLKWLVYLLAKRGIGFKLINVGGGVKRVTTDVKVCDKCGGTGRC